jgi:hypothetical protein
MREYQEILQIKQNVEGQLRSLPGVHAVGIGLKTIGGSVTDETAIAVFVTKKKSQDELRPDQSVPSEIDGVKTDIVEMPIPRRSFAANPNNLIVDMSPSTLTFSPSGTKPGAGLVIIIDFTVAPAQPDGANFAVTYETQADDTTETIAKNVAFQFNKGTPITNVTASFTLTSVVVSGRSGSSTTVTLTNRSVKPVDDAKYFKDWVRGGIQIQPGGEFETERIGTLGCLALLPATAQYPKDRIVALTCHHVVDLGERNSSNLTAVTNNTVMTLDTSDGDPIPPRTVLEVKFHTQPSAAAFYSTVVGDTAATIADHMYDTLQALALDGVTLTHTSGSKAITIEGRPFHPAITGATHGRLGFRPQSKSGWKCDHIQRHCGR